MLRLYGPADAAAAPPGSPLSPAGPQALLLRLPPRPALLWLTDHSSPRPSAAARSARLAPIPRWTAAAAPRIAAALPAAGDVSRRRRLSGPAGVAWRAKVA